MSDDLTPWDHGYIAWYSFQELSDNPYPPGSEEHEDWNDGFQTADEGNKARI